MPESLVMEIREYPGLVQYVHKLDHGELILNRMSPGCDLPMHRHDEAQFGFALAGGFDLFVDSNTAPPRRIEGGGAYSLEPWVTHGARLEGDHPIHTLDVKIRPPEGTPSFIVPARFLEGRFSHHPWGTWEVFGPFPWGLCSRFRFKAGNRLPETLDQGLPGKPTESFVLIQTSDQTSNQPSDPDSPWELLPLEEAWPRPETHYPKTVILITIFKRKKQA